MKHTKFLLPVAFAIASFSITVIAKADTVQARCDIYPAGSDRASSSSSCMFSQRQGVVSIQLQNGTRYELSPVGNDPGNYVDQNGKPAYRQAGLDDKGQIYRLANESIYVYWDAASGNQSDHSTTAPSTQTALAAQSVDPTLQTALRQAIGSYMQKSGITPDATQSFLADYIDLNDDGILDALVLLTGRDWCGTGGCTMLVFQGQGKDFRLVSSSTLIHPPVTVSDTKTNGWRDLIVDVSGGGATPSKVALTFNGTGYPDNPSTQPSLPANAAIAGTVVFPDGTEPQSMAEPAAQQSPAEQSAQPSFDCTQAQGEVETLICHDRELAALDRSMTGVYQTALQKAEQFPPQDLANFKAEQQRWINSRNDCWNAQEPSARDCVKKSYRDRIAELQANFALVPGRSPVFYTCNNNPANEIVATFYDTDPPTARLERGDTVITTLLGPTGSGARYEGHNVVFWIKGNEAMVNWKGEELQCQVK
jgi:uncharacterized protein